MQRFISEDPIEFAAGDPNLYVYTENSPTNFTDPSGNFVAMPAIAATLCGVGAASGVYAAYALAGRKGPSLGGILAGAAGGCAAGFIGGWVIRGWIRGPCSIRDAAGGQGVFWVGIGEQGAQLAAAEAVGLGAATVQSTFLGSAIVLATRLGLSGAGALPLWRPVSANFASSARTATVLMGSAVHAGSVFATKELPALLENGANIAYRFFR